MRAAASARAVRLGGVTVAPGESRTIALPLPAREGEAATRDAVPVSVFAGKHPGPRITIVGAVRGFEATGARAAARVAAELSPDALTGSVIIAPVLRPGGRFAAGGRPVPRAAGWQFPGDAGGRRHARDAFAVFSELFVGSSIAIVLGEAEPGYAAATMVRGDLEDPRVRRLAMHLPVAAIAHIPRRPGSLAAAGSDIGTVVVELWLGADLTDGDGAAHGVLLRVLRATGVLAIDAPTPRAGARPTVFTHLEPLRAAQGGLIERAARAGDIVSRGGELARILSPLGEQAASLVAPHDCLVLEATLRGAVRRGARLFSIGRVSSSAARRARRPAAEIAPQPLRVGWSERVSLPGLGLTGLRAKIDTGARTSALHVTRMRVVGTEAGPQRRPILEVTLPAAPRRGARAPSVRIAVRDYLTVKDTSGRTERRPVIETTIRLGTIERRIRVTLTDRGDMLFPMLIGRTALGPGVVVDPSRRRLLGQGHGFAPPTGSTRAKTQES